jgi:hypothetical protein
LSSREKENRKAEKEGVSLVDGVSPVATTVPTGRRPAEAMLAEAARA